MFVEQTNQLLLIMAVQVNCLGSPHSSCQRESVCVGGGDDTKPHIFNMLLALHLAEVAVL